MVELKGWVGADLGKRVVSYDERDAILYALAVGARADELELVFERDLEVLPTFGLTLGLWAADAASAAGAFVPADALHGSQSLTVRSPLPRTATFEIFGSIAGLWDTGRSAILDVVAECEYFTARYSIFLPGQGGFGGGKPPATRLERLSPESRSTTFRVGAEQAALYRLTGDKHLIHIDPAAARAAGFERPILHGLCTLGIAAREVARAVGAAPWELRTIGARFAAPVPTGSELVTTTSAAENGGPVSFEASVAGARVLSAGYAGF